MLDNHFNRVTISLVISQHPVFFYSSVNISKLKLSNHNSINSRLRTLSLWFYRIRCDKKNGLFFEKLLKYRIFIELWFWCRFPSPLTVSFVSNSQYRLWMYMTNKAWVRGKTSKWVLPIFHFYPFVRVIFSSLFSTAVDRK